MQHDQSLRATTNRRRRGGWRPLAAMAFAGLAGTAAVCAQPAEVDELPGHDAPSTIVIAPPEEPGERLVVRGQVFAPDGETPVEGVVLYVYHTGIDGRYAPPGEEIPRLRGWLRTGAGGRYEYETIRPGAYPGGGTAEHVHVFLWGAGHEPQWSDSVKFSDDPLLPDSERESSHAAGRFGHVCTPERTGDGALLCTIDYRLKPEGDTFQEEIRHGFIGPDEEGG